MADVIKLYRDAAEARGRDLFACTASEWRFLLELGRTFGWEPRGTTYELPPGSKLAVAARRDYEPGAPGDRKVVEKEDAIAWARALDDAQDSAHLRAMIETRSKNASAGESTERSITDSIAEFVQYAYGGAFTFSSEVETGPAPKCR